jgi:hypothetical protein
LSHGGASYKSGGTNVTAQVRYIESWMCKLYIRWNKCHGSNSGSGVIAVLVTGVEETPLPNTNWPSYGSAATRSGVAVMSLPRTMWRWFRLHVNFRPESLVLLEIPKEPVQLIRLQIHQLIYILSIAAQFTLPEVLHSFPQSL